MKPTTQRAAILLHLISGRRLTARQALEKYGCFRLASRINELGKNWEISREILTDKKTKKRFASYKLEGIRL